MPTNAIIEHHLTKNRYNQRSTAKALGLTYDQLRHCMKKKWVGGAGWAVNEGESHGNWKRSLTGLIRIYLR